MLIRHPSEYTALKEIGKIVAEVLAVLSAAAKPGITTFDLDILAGKELLKRGARSTPAWYYNFPGNVCLSVNDEVVHGIPSKRILLPGDLLKIDLTADKNGFIADAARTVLLVEQVADFSSLSLMRCVEEAFRRACQLLRPGIFFSDIGMAIEDTVNSYGFSVITSLGGHGVGRNIHELPEVPNFFDKNNSTVISEGTVLTIEPIACEGVGRVRESSDNWTLLTVGGGKSVHYEETVLVRRHGAEILTSLK